VPTEVGAPYAGRTRRGRPAAEQFVLCCHHHENETYCGVYYWGKRKFIRKEEGEHKTVKVIERPKEQWIAVKVPPILSRKVWERAQVRLDENRRWLRGRSTQKYLLTKHFHCVCGRAMIGNLMGGDRRYYNCGDRAYVYQERCPHSRKRLRADIVETAVFDYLESVIFAPQNLLEGLRQHQEATESATRTLLARSAAIDREVEETQRKIDSLVEMRLEGDITKSEYQAKRGQLLNLVKRREEEKADILKRLERQVVTEETEQSILAFCEQVRVGWEKTTFEDRRKLLRKLAVEVVYNGDQTITVSGFIPTKKM
jgi:site-specific DNA recombinase